MKLYAISDLHLGYEVNRQALEALPAYPEDWLILGGDIGETLAHLEFALDVLVSRFRRLLWVPGNHELWTLPTDTTGLRGEAKYNQLVSLCRSHNVLTPEDPYMLWTGEGQPCVLVPLFLLYDYSFCPDEVSADQAVNWAAASGVFCTDEVLLHPDPYPSIPAWCEVRCRLTEARLADISTEYPLVLINHFPLRQDLVRLSSIPRFSVWCGTRRTKYWLTRFRTKIAVTGHLHIRSTDWRDGVRFEEVSLGYPKQWRRERGIEAYLREILPGPAPSSEFGAPQWYR